MNKKQKTADEWLAKSRSDMCRRTLQNIYRQTKDERNSAGLLGFELMEQEVMHMANLGPIRRTRPSTTTFDQRTTLSLRNVAAGAGIGVGLGLGYAVYRRWGLRVHVHLIGIANEPPNHMSALVRTRARGLWDGDWVDYQISWGSGAVPGADHNGVQNAHLGQVANTAGGWRRDLNANGQYPLFRENNNPMYQPDGQGTTNFDYNDPIRQHRNMVMDPQGDNWWRFRAIIKNSMGVPLKWSNEIQIDWPNNQQQAPDNNIFVDNGPPPPL